MHSLVSIPPVLAVSVPDDTFIAYQLCAALATIQSHSEAIAHSLSTDQCILADVEANNNALLMHVVRLRSLIDAHYDVRQYEDAGERDDAQWDSLSGE